MTVPKPQALNCPNCGAALELRGFAHSLTIACPQCQSVLDAKDPHLQILQKVQARTSSRIRIPLGTRGQIRGAPYEVIGFQERTITVEGVDYSWNEYLLFNPYKGFLYLTEYNGHWNLVRTLRALPAMQQGKRPVAYLKGERFAHFQTSQARTTYVIGEFPWQVRLGDAAAVMDFVAPPRMLSSERTGAEVTWSLGEYIPGSEIWKMFQLPGKAPYAQGVYANQPSPYQGAIARVWTACAYLLLALFAAAMAIGILSRDEVVFDRQYAVHAGAARPFVTDVFQLKGRPSNVEVEIHTNLENQWAGFVMALINDETGEAFDFGREVSYYHGRDSDGSWSEGSRDDSVTLSPVPSGRYYLRVEPAVDDNAPPVNYQLIVKRDVPVSWLYGVALLLLLAPPVVVTIRALRFNHRRWQESDYGS